MTAADRFAEQLRRRVEALDKWPGPDLNWAFIPFSGAVERDKLLAALLRQPERGAP
jgi:hypothetical protein